MAVPSCSVSSCMLSIVVLSIVVLSAAAHCLAADSGGARTSRSSHSIRWGGVSRSSYCPSVTVVTKPATASAAKSKAIGKAMKMTLMDSLAAGAMDAAGRNDPTNPVVEQSGSVALEMIADRRAQRTASPAELLEPALNRSSLALRSQDQPTLGRKETKLARKTPGRCQAWQISDLIALPSPNCPPLHLTPLHLTPRHVIAYRGFAAIVGRTKKGKAIISAATPATKRISFIFFSFQKSSI